MYVEIVDDLKENDLSCKNITLTNKQLLELSSYSKALKKAGLNISPSNLIRLCLDESLERIKEKMFSIAGLA